MMLHDCRTAGRWHFLKSSPLVLLLPLAAQTAITTDCASGTHDSGKNCPPNDSNSLCPPGCELAASSAAASGMAAKADAATTCATYPTASSFGIEYPCGYANGVYTSPQPLSYLMEITSGDSGALAFTLTVEAYQMNTHAYCYDGLCTATWPTVQVKLGDTWSTACNRRATRRLASWSTRCAT